MNFYWCLSALIWLVNLERHLVRIKLIIWKLTYLTFDRPNDLNLEPDLRNPCNSKRVAWLVHKTDPEMTLNFLKVDCRIWSSLSQSGSLIERTCLNEKITYYNSIDKISQRMISPNVHVHLLMRYHPLNTLF